MTISWIHKINLSSSRANSEYFHCLSYFPLIQYIHWEFFLIFIYVKLIFFFQFHHTLDLHVFVEWVRCQQCSVWERQDRIQGPECHVAGSARFCTDRNDCWASRDTVPTRMGLWRGKLPYIPVHRAVCFLFGWTHF